MSDPYLFKNDDGDPTCKFYNWNNPFLDDEDTLVLGSCTRSVDYTQVARRIRDYARAAPDPSTEDIIQILKEELDKN